MNSKKMFYGWKVVIGSVVLLALLAPAAVALANIFQNAVTADFGIKQTSFALSNAILHLMGIFFAPIISRFLVTDFKKTHAIGVVLFSLGFAAYGAAPNIFVFYLLSIVIGIGFQMATMIPVSMMITNWFQEKRGLAMSLAMSGIGIGGAILSPLLTNMIDWVTWRWTYIIYGIAMIVICLPIALFVFKEKPEQMGLVAYGADKVRDPKVKANQVKRQPITMSVKDSFSKPFFLFLMLGTVLVGMSNNAGLGQFPPFLQDLYGANTAALLISVYSLIGIPGKLIMGSLNDKFGIRLTTIYAGILMTATYLLMTVAQLNPAWTWVAILSSVAFGLGNANGTILNPLITSDIFAAKDYGIAYGFVTSAMQIGMSTGSLIAASIADFSGNFTLSWLVAAGFVIAATVLWLMSLTTSNKYRK